jgi:hypothetical protein
MLPLTLFSKFPTKGTDMPLRSKWTSAVATAATTLLVGTVLAITTVDPANAAGRITFSVDAPTVQGSVVEGVTLATFDGGCVNPLPFGSFTGDCYSNLPNHYSGASTTSSAPTTGGTGTPLAVIPSGGTATFDLDAPARYLGFHWEAGNEFDRVRLYSGNKLLADFPFEALMEALQGTELESAEGGTTYTVADYFGNPVTGAQGHEPYAYIHIVASEGLTFDRIDFAEDAGSPGEFEFDNMAVLFSDDDSITDSTFDDVVDVVSVNVRSSGDELAKTGAGLTDGVLFASLGILAVAAFLRRRATRH